MTKGELVYEMAKRAGLSRMMAAQALNALTDVVAESLESGDRVALIGFGRWQAAPRAERRCKNPRTGEWMTIPARHVPVFRPGIRLKRALAND